MPEEEKDYERNSILDHLNRAETLLDGGIDAVEVQKAQAHAMLATAQILSYMMDSLGEIAACIGDERPSPSSEEFLSPTATSAKSGN